MNRSIYLFFFILLLSVVACDQAEKGGGKGKRKKDGLVKQYRSDGSLKTEITFKNGKKNGSAKSYYKNGKLRQQISYVNNVKHGEATTYYENGKPYQITLYENGKIHGIRKKYRMDGRVSAEVPYNKGVACKGLKEYLLNGDIKKKYPKIVIREIDNLLKSNEFILRISISDNSKKATYYIGDLDSNGCISDDAMKVMPQRPGVLDLKYNVGPGMFMMEKLNIIAVVETKLGNPYVLERKHNLAIENRG
ncbi:toxin-antitoxin system YwqK family antitoxin [Fulvivirga sp. 29W222]|uniref:Toxin-antitoxin system YwqK family antitoxin n=1 Tax=Fulvivirga marina TaxID=2494733 RepID=A0A937G140_9BACT|nr:toxin-antitoxin system YwqK family antitoxin [Fulvivirga marina]MBL6449889.1 toxin-antitoxin system YwqK family antitoxin [Fulvivirga marina]